MPDYLSQRSAALDKWLTAIGGRAFVFYYGGRDMAVDIVALDHAIYRISHDAKLRGLAQKYAYDPRRRYENEAGSKPITSAQTSLLLELCRHRYLATRDLWHLLNKVWDMDCDDWTSSDAMFVINALKNAPLDPRRQEQNASGAQEQVEQLPYDQYLKTSHWREDVRPAALERADYKCQLCGTRDATLHVHHNTYENLGKEAPSDLVVLCEDCHKRFHDARRYNESRAGRRKYIEERHGQYIEGMR